MFQRRLKQIRVQTLSIGKRYELSSQFNIFFDQVNELCITVTNTFNGIFVSVI